MKNKMDRRFTAWLIYDEEGAARNRDYIALHYETGLRYGIQFQLKMAGELYDRRIQENPDVKPDFAIVRTIHPALSRKLEQAGIPIFNNSFVAEICNDKGKTIAYIQKNSTIPVIATEAFTNKELSKELLHEYPGFVIKAVDGHGGRQVFRTEEDFAAIRNGMGNSDFIVQPFVRGPGKDIRVYVIGDEVVGAVERTSPDGFKSNFSLGGAVRSYTLSDEERNLVDQICSLFSFGMVGIDFLMDEKGRFVFNEIEDVAGARMLYQCQPKIGLLERYFSFIIDKMLHYH